MGGASNAACGNSCKETRSFQHYITAHFDRRRAQGREEGERGREGGREGGKEGGH